MSFMRIGKLIMVVGVAMSALSVFARARADYSDAMRFWPQMKGLSFRELPKEDDFRRLRAAGATLCGGRIDCTVSDWPSRVREALALGREYGVRLCLRPTAKAGLAWRDVVAAVKDDADALYAYDVGDRRGDIPDIRAVDAETPVVVSYCGKTGGEALEAGLNVIYAVPFGAGGAASDERLREVREFQLETGARILARGFGFSAASGERLLTYGWDWMCREPETGAIGDETVRFLRDDRIQGWSAGTVRYPSRLSAGRRFRGCGYARPTDLEGLSDARTLGVNLVRLDMGDCWPGMRPATDEAVADYLANVERRIAEFRPALDRARELGLKVALLGPKPGGWMSHEEWNEHSVFQDAKRVAALQNAWRRIAKAFKGRSEIYGYDIFNEPLNREYPQDRIRYRDFMILMASAIREVDPDATLIVESNACGSQEGFDVKSRFGFVAMTPIPFDNVVYSVHLYWPMSFTHQGIGKGRDEFTPLPYPGANAPAEGGGRLDKDAVREVLRPVREFQRLYGARIWVGEFSAAAWAPGAERYLADLIDLFEEYGWDWSYHSFRENVIWSLEHEGADNQSLKKSQAETPRLKVLKAGWARNAQTSAAASPKRPKFAWRGYLLDVSRHFFDVEEIKRVLDSMAKVGLNVFHWHLTDTGGWRLPVAKYPKLTESAATREADKFRPNCCQNDGPTGKYGRRFYTRQDIGDVIAYADALGIRVVPEVDIPGHESCAIAAYPELGCQGLPNNGDFCLGDDGVMQWFKDVLDEVMELFPDEVVHTGGDECQFQNWKTCTKSQARIRTLGLKDELALQGWMTGQIAEYLASKGRRMMIWHNAYTEYLDLPKSVIVQTYYRAEGGIRYAEHGFDVVMSPAEYCYLDFSPALKGDWAEYQPFGTTVSLDKIARFDPTEGASAAARRHILGGEACMWTELVYDLEGLEWRSWPRAAAIADVLVRGPAKDKVAYRARVEALREALVADGVGAAPMGPTYDPLKPPVARLPKVYRPRDQLSKLLVSDIDRTTIDWTANPDEFSVRKIVGRKDASLGKGHFKVDMNLKRILLTVGDETAVDRALGLLRKLARTKRGNVTEFTQADIED